MCLLYAFRCPYNRQCRRNVVITEPIKYIPDNRRPSLHIPRDRPGRPASAEVRDGCTIFRMSDDFDRALAELRFSDAAEFISDDDTRAERLEAERAAAEQRARELSSTIQRLAREHQFETLLEIADDESTARLVGLLPQELARGAEVQLEGARKWRLQKVTSAQRHLRRATEAIDGYDTARGRMELSKIDSQWLDEDEASLRAQLESRLDAVAAERMEIEQRTNQVLTEHQTKIDNRRRIRNIGWILGIVIVVIIGAFIYLTA